MVKPNYLLISSLIKLLLIPHFFIQGVISSATFTLSNTCDYTVWPGILSNAAIPQLATTGFVLNKGESRTINAPASWGGRFWGRTHCTQDSTGNFACATGDCGSGKLECDGNVAVPPATLAEFTLDGGGGLDFYDVSLVDGYNLPMVIVPQGGTGLNCSTTGCIVDLNDSCPSELKVTASSGGDGVACKSACEAFGDAEYCCSGEYATPDTCKPSSYSEVFKAACPTAYSYAYDDKTSTFTCADADYLIVFCPSPSPTTTTTTATTSQKSSDPTPPGRKNGIVYDGLSEVSSATSLLGSNVMVAILVAGVWRFSNLLI